MNEAQSWQWVIQVAEKKRFQRKKLVADPLRYKSDTLPTTPPKESLISEVIFQRLQVLRTDARFFSFSDDITYLRLLLLFLWV